jgi:hypothetical protein
MTGGQLLFCRSTIPLPYCLTVYYLNAPTLRGGG